MQKLLFNPANFITHLSMLRPALYNGMLFTLRKTYRINGNLNIKPPSGISLTPSGI